MQHVPPSVYQTSDQFKNPSNKQDSSQKLHRTTKSFSSQTMRLPTSSQQFSTFPQQNNKKQNNLDNPHYQKFQSFVSPRLYPADLNRQNTIELRRQQNLPIRTPPPQSSSSSSSQPMNRNKSYPNMPRQNLYTNTPQPLNPSLHTIHHYPTHNNVQTSPRNEQQIPLNAQSVPLNTQSVPLNVQFVPF
ncbi:MAG: hypothetical protein EZS28_052087, partial [Streblomastix strix]